MKQQRHQVPFALWIVWKLFCLHSGHPLSKITLSLRVGSGHKPKPFRGWSPGDTDPCWTESNISDITVDTQHSASLTSLACEIKQFMKAQVVYYKEMWRHVTHAMLSLTNNPLIQQLYTEVHILSNSFTLLLFKYSVKKKIFLDDETTNMYL